MQNSKANIICAQLSTVYFFFVCWLVDRVLLYNKRLYLYKSNNRDTMKTRIGTHGTVYNRATKQYLLFCCTKKKNIENIHDSVVDSE